MSIENRLNKLENITQPRDPAIWIARQVERSDAYNVTAPRSEGHRLMAAREIEEMLTGTVVFVVRSAETGGL